MAPDRIAYGFHFAAGNAVASSMGGASASYTVMQGGSAKTSASKVFTETDVFEVLVEPNKVPH